MRVTAIRTQTERNRQGKFVRHAEERRGLARMLRVRGLIRPHSSVQATADDARGEKHLLSGKVQAISPSIGRPLGECRLFALALESARKRRKGHHLTEINEALPKIAQSCRQDADASFGV
jgi:hypothetical protein